MSTTTERRAVALPKRSPVTIVHLCAKNDYNGNPRRCFVVTTLSGDFVESIDEGYEGESAAYKRWPWFNHSAARRLGIDVRYMQRYDVTPGEYKRELKREPWEGTEKLRHRADRYEKHYDSFGNRRA